MSQITDVIEYIKNNGSITTLQGFEIGCARLSARVYEMRSHNIDIRSEMITVKNRKGEDCRVAKYFIPGGVPDCFKA